MTFPFSICFNTFIFFQQIFPHAIKGSAIHTSNPNIIQLINIARHDISYCAVNPFLYKIYAIIHALSPIVNIIMFEYFDQCLIIYRNNIFPPNNTGKNHNVPIPRQLTVKKRLLLINS